MLTISNTDPSFCPEIDELKDYYNRQSFLMRIFLIPSLIGRQLTTQNSFEIFQLANTFRFKAILWLYNLFASVPIDFFNSKRFLGCTQLLLNEQLTHDNFSRIASHQHPLDVAWALTIAHVNGLLEGEQGQINGNAIASHPNPIYLRFTLELVSKNSLLKGEEGQANFDAIVSHQYPIALYEIFNLLLSLHFLITSSSDIYFLSNESSVNAFNQNNFNQVIQYSNLLFNNEDLRNLWGYIPSYQFKLEDWNRIVQICQANQDNLDDGVVQLTRYINETLLLITQQNAQTFNPPQSTHTPSIHKTVSESAARLNNRYSARIENRQLNAMLKTIKNWVHKQPENQNAKIAIDSLIKGSFHTVDRISNVATQQLLGLIWCAMHDDTQRQGSLEDAQKLFLEGLYEIQRAYNLSDTGEDMGGHDSAACAGGTFNKLIEKLVGVHPDAQQEYITPQGALRKLTPLIKEEAKLYLAQSDNPANINLMSLKKAILPNVRKKLYFEYGQEVFQSLTKPYETFKQFVTSSDYEDFQKELKTNHSNVGLELLIEGKLLADEPDIDNQLKLLIDEELNKKPSANTEFDAIDESSTVSEKPETKEELRNARIRFFVTPHAIASAARDLPALAGSLT